MNKELVISYLTYASIDDPNDETLIRVSLKNDITPEQANYLNYAFIIWTLCSQLGWYGKGYVINMTDRKVKGNVFSVHCEVFLHDKVRGFEALKRDLKYVPTIEIESITIGSDEKMYGNISGNS